MKKRCAIELPGKHGAVEVCAACYAAATASVSELRRALDSASSKMLDHGNDLRRRIDALSDQNARLRAELQRSEAEAAALRLHLTEASEALRNAGLR